MPRVYTLSPTDDSTLALEIPKLGLFKRQRKEKLLFFFERFHGHMTLDALGDPKSAQFELSIDAASVIDKQKSRAAEILAAPAHPAIRFVSSEMQPKELRGFNLHGHLQVRGITQSVRANLLLHPRSGGEFLVEGDAAVRLSSFAIARSGVADEGLIHFLLRAIPSPA